MLIRVPLAKPTLGPEEEAAVCEVLRSGWISQGPRVVRFEQELAKAIGVQHVVAVNSGTSALMLALRAFGIGPADSVIVPAFSCAATALPVLETGAGLRFADVDLATFNVTWESIARELDETTRAVIVAHMFGRVADMDVIASERKRRGLVLIEDAALAFGARKSGQCAGSFGQAGCFSFHPRKILTTGEGGAVCTNDPRAAEQVAADRSYGAVQSAWARFQTGEGSPSGFSRLAFNLKLTDLQAAIGLVQLTRWPDFIASRRRIARTYLERLRGCECLRLPEFPSAEEEHVFQAFVCMWQTGGPGHTEVPVSNLALLEERARAFRQAVQDRGIAISDAAQFLPELPVFGQAHLARSCLNALLASRLSFALPIYPSMAEAEVEAVVESVEAAARAEPRASG